ncbi:conserved hypothetical protein [Altererythrobacter sp. B11]|uniref:ribbon-helix-helix domain-containing protein n=1 Tax=Altererythrobacter sp. B11 TaxID=2060312 RepID=UPI000DC6FB9A|nr:conserved hypothetical protein [Altererythrobacter sp. B11]
MASIKDNKKSRGRPVTTGTGTMIGVRLQDEQLRRLDSWIEEAGGHLSRPEAIRRLLEHAWGRTAAAKGIGPLSGRLGPLPGDD